MSLFRLLSILILTSILIANVSPILSDSPPDPDLWTAQTRLIAFEKWSSLSQSPEFTYRDDRGYDVTHYALFLTPDFSTRSLTGRTVISALSTRTDLSIAQFDFGSRMTVLSVKTGEQELEFNHTDGLIDVTLDHLYSLSEPFTIDIVYTGIPKFWTFVFTDHAGLPMFSTMAEPIGAREWWPCNDQPTDKATVEIHATVPDWMAIASNGLKTNDLDHGDGTRTISWASNYVMPTYLVSCAGSDYVEIPYEYVSLDQQTTMPVPVYIQPDLEASARIDFADTVDMIEYFASSFGEYPFLLEKYGQAAVNTGGGMEHQTITHINKGYISGHGLMNLVSHELAHMWWGDCITMETWPDIWLNEGFATYSAALYTEHRFGYESLRNIMDSYATTQFEGTVYDPVQLFGDTVYLKGAWVLHMLRGMLGDSTFFAILQSYYADDRFRFGNATTAEFTALCSSVSGLDLTGFFDQWLFRDDRPSYMFSWDYSASEEGFLVTVSIDQVQEGELYAMPMELLIVTDDGDVRSQITVDDAHESFEIPVTGLPRDISLDPDSWVLKWLSPALDQFQISTARKLPVANYGSLYSCRIDTLNGIPPITFSVVSGELPPGISLDASGNLSGFPLKKGSYVFTIQAEDSRSLPISARKELLLKIGAESFHCSLSCNTTYLPGDVMTVHLDLENKTEEPLNVQLYMGLEIGGAFFFISPFPEFPAFSNEPYGYDFTAEADFEVSSELFRIAIPSESADVSGSWHIGAVNPANGTVWGEISSSSFSIQ